MKYFFYKLSFFLFMILSRENSLGLMVTIMMEIIRKILKMDIEYVIIQMVNNMKVNELMIRKMEKYFLYLNL